MYVQCKGNSSLTTHLFWQLVHNQIPKGCFSRRSCCSGSNRECRGFQCYVIRLSNHSFKSSPCTWVWRETETYLHLWCAHYSSDKCCILSLSVILSSFGVKCKCRWQESSTSCHQTDEQGWGDENSWGGDAADGNNEPDTISLQELQSSLVEAGYLAAAATRHHHVSNQGQETQSSSPDVGTLGQRNPESNLPSMMFVVDSLIYPYAKVGMWAYTWSLSSWMMHKVSWSSD